MDSLGKILVVDDEISIRSIIRYTLESEGFTVYEAGTGDTVEKMIVEYKPDLVLLDYHMPGKDGIEVLADLRQGRLTKTLPVIMLTANSEREVRIDGLKNGANDFLNKPFVSEELLLRVRNTLQHNQKHRDANPLTGLPGNHAIESELEDRISALKPYALLYIDLDNFKAYNDFYGYSKGDTMLTLLADVLSESVQKYGDNETFLGHVGGDDFVIMSSPDLATQIATGAIKRFDSRIEKLYEPEDWAQGYLEIKDRQGDVRKFPPTSITIAMVADSNNQLRHAGKVNAIIAELKKYGKSFDGSVLVQDRRDSGVKDRCELIYSGGINA
jgi:diguanylate cyclase (GGDEF)-like protein